MLGKHVFVAKPIAVDAPGCLSVADFGKHATAKKLVFLVDFQTRANEHYRKALQMVRNGVPIKEDKPSDEELFGELDRLKKENLPLVKTRPFVLSPCN